MSPIIHIALAFFSDSVPFNFLAICTLDYKQLFFIIDQPGVSYFVKYIVHGVLSSNEAYMIVWGLILSHRIIMSWTLKSPIAYAFGILKSETFIMQL